MFLIERQDGPKQSEYLEIFSLLQNRLRSGENFLFFEAKKSFVSYIHKKNNATVASERPIKLVFSCSGSFNAHPKSANFPRLSRSGGRVAKAN